MCLQKHIANVFISVVAKKDLIWMSVVNGCLVVKLKSSTYGNAEIIVIFMTCACNDCLSCTGVVQSAVLCLTLWSPVVTGLKMKKAKTG